MSQVEGSDSLGHLCRQLGSAQAHMGFGGPVTLKLEMSQLSIDLTFSPLHSGQVRLGILSPLGLLVTNERAKGSVPFGAEAFRFRQDPTAREAEPSAVVPWRFLQSTSRYSILQRGLLGLLVWVCPSRSHRAFRCDCLLALRVQLREGSDQQAHSFATVGPLVRPPYHQFSIRHANFYRIALNEGSRGN